MVRILVLVLTVILMGCSHSVDLALDDEVTVFFSDQADREVRLTSSDTEYKVLSDWLNENKSGWYTTSGRYPNGVYIKTGQHGIQITATQVVIYSSKQPEPRAIYTQNIANGELAVIRALAHNK